MRLAGRLTVFAAALALALALAAAAAAAPRSAIVRTVDVGNGAAESWLFLPEHAAHCVVVVLHDSGDLTPVRYDSLLEYLALSKGCAAVYPRYQATKNPSTPAATLSGLRAALNTTFTYLRGPASGLGGQAASDALPVTVFGFGTGGTLAFSAARSAKAWGFPVPAAVDSVFPSGAITGLPIGPLAAGTRVLIQVGDQQSAAARATGSSLWKALASQPAVHKKFQLVRSYGSLRAGHSAPLLATTAAEKTFWLPLDALIDASIPATEP